MDLPTRGDEPGVQVNLRLPAKVLDALDEARGRLNRQQWIRWVIVEWLRLHHGYSAPRQD